MKSMLHVRTCLQTEPDPLKTKNKRLYSQQNHRIKKLVLEIEIKVLTFQDKTYVLLMSLYLLPAIKDKSKKGRKFFFLPFPDRKPSEFQASRTFRKRRISLRHENM